MPGDSDEIVVITYFDSRRFWIIVPLHIAGRPNTINMVLDTGSIISTISEPIFRELEAGGLVETVGRNSYILRGLTIQGQDIADLVIRVGRRVTAVGADGALGLDFLGLFTDIHFNLPSMRLRPVDP